MIVRKAEASDLSAIVELLRLSLGESLMPKSESFWRWKHIDNPFGMSPVLLAVENDKIVGVRAFMRWEWQSKGVVFKAVRAVDTATHPEYQGKGIFTRLTMALIDLCTKEGIQFVFNTPNNASKPGYLKMGWESVGKMPLRIKFNFSWKGQVQHFDEKYAIGNLFDRPEMAGLTSYRGEGQYLTTHYSVAYLKWRYRLNPNIRYFACSRFSGESSFVFVFRIKASRFGKELRVCDVFTGSEIDFRELRRELRGAGREAGVRLLTFAGKRSDCPFGGLAAHVGPEITVRKLNTSGLPLLTFEHWNPSLGDMEVF